MNILNSSEKKKILRQLDEQYGIDEIPYLFLKFGNEKIRLYSGSLSKEELSRLDKNLRIEVVGLYFANQKEGIRLTLDGLQLLKNKITKNIININDKQAEEWLKGQDIYINDSYGFKVLKNNDNFLGCGKSTGYKISNFVPKERRIK